MTAGVRLHAEDAMAVQFRAPLLRYFRRRGVDDIQCEDLAHEVFARVCKRSLDGIPNPQAYVFSAASSVYIDHVRRLKTRGDAFYEQVEEIELPSEAPGAVRVLEGKQRLERLKVILEELPERTREILLLSRLEGLSNTQLAARFGLSVSAIEKNLMRALVHIRSRSVADE